MTTGRNSKWGQGDPYVLSPFLVPDEIFARVNMLSESEDEIA